MLDEFDPEQPFVTQVEAIWHAVVEKLEQFPDKEANIWLRDFPKGSCEVTSWVIGRVLLKLGFGDWTLVYGSVDTEKFPNLTWGGHEWLEFTRDDGVFYSLDATAHQFSWAGPPFLMRGVSPLKEIYSVSRRQHLSSEMQQWFEHDLMALPLKYVERELLS